MNSIKSILTNKWFWIGAVILLVALVIYRKSDTLKQSLKNATKKQDVDFEEGETVKVSSVRKQQLEKAAQDIFNDIDDTPIFESRNWAAYGVAKNATDNELKYLAKYYSSNLSKSSLYQDLSDEAFIDNRTLVNELKSRLTKMGLQ